MKTLEEKFREASNFDLAAEVAFTLLAKDSGQNAISQIAAIVGFKRMVMLLVVLGGKNIHIPMLKELPKKFLLAKCALLVVVEGKPLHDVAVAHNIPAKLITKAARRLRDQMVLRNKVAKEFAEVEEASDIHHLFSQFGEDQPPSALMEDATFSESDA